MASVPPAALRTSPATPSRHDPGAVGKGHFVEPVAGNNSRQCHSGSPCNASSGMRKVRVHRGQRTVMVDKLRQTLSSREEPYG